MKKWTYRWLFIFYMGKYSFSFHTLSFSHAFVLSLSLSIYLSIYLSISIYIYPPIYDIYIWHCNIKWQNWLLLRVTYVRIILYLMLLFFFLLLIFYIFQYDTMIDGKVHQPTKILSKNMNKWCIFFKILHTLLWSVLQCLNSMSKNYQQHIWCHCRNFSANEFSSNELLNQWTFLLMNISFNEHFSQWIFQQMNLLANKHFNQLAFQLMNL